MGIPRGQFYFTKTLGGIHPGGMIVVLGSSPGETQWRSLEEAGGVGRRQLRDQAKGKTPK